MLNFSHEGRNTLLRKYQGEMTQIDNCWAVHQGRKETGYFEGKMAYAYVRETMAEVVFEAGPWHGFSTYPLALGVKNNGAGKVYSFESNQGYLEVAIKNIERAGLSEYVEFILGGFIETSPPILKKVKEIDIFYQDSSHDGYFAEWYIANIFPHVKYLVFVHDMTYGSTCTELGVPPNERFVIEKFLGEHPEYQYFRMKDYFPHNSVEKRRGPGGSANSGVWIKMPKR